MSSFWSDFEHKCYNLASNFLQIKQIKVLPIGMLCRLCAAPNYLRQEILFDFWYFPLHVLVLACTLMLATYLPMSFFFFLQWNVVYSLCLALGSGLYSICPTHRLHDRIQGFLGRCSVLVWVVHILSLFLPWSAIWSPESPTVYQQRKCVAHHKTTRQRGTYSWLATS